MLRSARILLTPTLLGLTAFLACGPSVSSIYEGNIRFEHCYRLDLDPRVSPNHRKACWDEWSRRYTYGQTRDRLEYARRRMGQLESGDPKPLELALTPGDAGLDGPAPVSPHGPPPPLAAPLKSASPAAPDAGAPKPKSAPPQEDCALDCRESWRSCRDECDPEATSRRRSCKACDKDYGRCVQRCFK